MGHIYRILFGLHIFVGVGALFGGLAAIINPHEPLGMSTEYLKYSPFNSYLIPGIILFTIIGLGNIISGVALRLKFKYQAYSSIVFSSALAVWIIVQCIMLNAVAFLHVLFFIIGLAEMTLSMIILFKYRLFPANIIVKIKEKG